MQEKKGVSQRYSADTVIIEKLFDGEFILRFVKADKQLIKSGVERDRDSKNAQAVLYHNFVGHECGKAFVAVIEKLSSCEEKENFKSHIHRIWNF